MKVIFKGWVDVHGLTTALAWPKLPTNLFLGTPLADYVAIISEDLAYLLLATVPPKSQHSQLPCNSLATQTIKWLTTLLSSSSEPTTRKSKAGALKKLIQEVLSDSDDNNSSNTASPSVRDPSRPWRAEFLSYLETIEAVPPTGMSTIQWWGINAPMYQMWASLTRDYLSIMTSSVSSDIVEALQSLKCSLHNDLLFREAGPSSLVEEELNDSDTKADISEKEGDVADDERGWDTLILDDENNSDDDISVSEIEPCSGQSQAMALADGLA
ncbi:hypothetical protein EDD22DRAFT_962677 [Suillus occidentalis]|nr:hypothetical protein EDD22DRAFT_962677 [Suillus occidentalis]